MHNLNTREWLIFCAVTVFCLQGNMQLMIKYVLIFCAFDVCAMFKKSLIHFHVRSTHAIESGEKLWHIKIEFFTLGQVMFYPIKNVQRRI